MTAHNPGPALPLRTALDHSEPLAQLMRRLKASNDRFDAIAGELSPELRTLVQPGPLDDAGWTLMVAHSAAAAKLRQLLPALEAALAARGLPPLKIRIKVHSPR